MYLDFSQISHLIDVLDPPLIEGLEKYQLTPAERGGIVEGPCVEARIGKVLRPRKSEIPLLSYDFSGSVKRFVPSVDTMYDYTDTGLGKEFIVRKGESIIVETIERINLPNFPDLSLMCHLIPRFSLARMGLLMLNSDADPGYSGNLIVVLVNIGSYDQVKLALGARILKLRFINVGGFNPSYIGKFGGKPGGIKE